MRKREFAMQMRKCERAIDRCDAITFKSLANAMRMRKWIRITSPAIVYDWFKLHFRAHRLVYSFLSFAQLNPKPTGTSLPSFFFCSRRSTSGQFASVWRVVQASLIFFLLCCTSTETLPPLLSSILFRALSNVDYKLPCSRWVGMFDTFQPSSLSRLIIGPESMTVFLSIIFLLLLSNATGSSFETTLVYLQQLQVVKRKICEAPVCESCLVASR
jgi:hypothetical protein